MARSMPPKRKHDEVGEADAASDAESTHDDSQLKAAKDRECPFCHQAFTSSSLGRHLDLYIRPINPKRADGIHKVDEIRQLRGGITRRQPKGFKSKDKDERATTVESDDAPTLASRQLPRPSSYVNGMDWRTTGVINETKTTSTSFNDSRSLLANGRAPGPQPPESHGSTASRPPTNGNTPRLQLSSLDTRGAVDLDEQLETGRAAELALQEIMDSLAAAQREYDHTVPFDGVDLCTLSFPALCLTLLPAPTTLFTTTPFASRDSWDLTPPHQRERRCLETVVERQRLPLRLRDHINAAYEQWTRLSEAERSSNWSLEVLRAYSNAKSITDGLKQQLSLAKQRIAHLEKEYDLLSNCQLPRERMLNSPTTVPIPQSVFDHFGVDSARAMIEKSRSNIRLVTKKKLSKVTYLEPAADQATDQGQEPGTLTLSSDMIMGGAVFGVEGPMERTALFAKSSELAKGNNGKAPVSELVEHG